MLELAPGTLAGFGLYLVRVSALVLAAPMIGNASPFSGYKVGLIAALSLLMYSVGGEPVGSVGPIAFGAMAMREVLLGLVLAFVLHATVIAVRVAGELIGHEMAFTMSSQVDPATGISTPLITQVYEGFFLLGLLAVDGHHLLFRALSDSFVRAPVGDVGVQAGLSSGVLQLFSDLFAAGLTFAAPVMVVLVLTSVLIGLLARAVPQLNVLEVGFTLRISMALLAMFVFAPLMAPAMERLYLALADGLGGVLDLMEA